MSFQYDLSIIIPSYNEEMYIRSCLLSITSQSTDYLRYEVILVDNGSTDQTIEIAKNFPVKIFKYLNANVGAVRNYGAKCAKSTNLAFIDADCVLPQNWIKQAYEKISSCSNTVLGGGITLREEPYWLEKLWLLESDRPPNDLLGACIIVKREDFFLIGGFDENITSGEDSKLSRSFDEAGYNVLISTDMNVRHLGNPTTAKEFILRQIWHSENYLNDPLKSIKDPTFLILILTIFILGTLLYSIGNSGWVAILSFLFILAIPLIFSAKRLHRAKFIPRSIVDFLGIYILDSLYVTGRIIGLVKSCFLKITLKK